MTALRNKTMTIGRYNRLSIMTILFLVVYGFDLKTKDQLVFIAPTIAFICKKRKKKEEKEKILIITARQRDWMKTSEAFLR